MKKVILTAAVALGALAASAQAIEQPSFFDNWSMGVVGGVTTPLQKGSEFFHDMRATVGVNLNKQVTPVFGVGVESLFGINTSRWPGRVHSSTAFDDSYVGAYGSVDLFNLFGGYPGYQRCFDMKAVAGAGWGHYFVNKMGPLDRKDWNYFATKAGLKFDFNVSNNVTIDVEPSVIFNMTDKRGSWEQTSAAYDRNNATFQVTAGVTYRFGGAKFDVVEPYNQLEVDALNAQVNALRGELEACMTASAVATAALEAQNASLAADLEACQNRPAEVVKEVSNQYNSVRFVFFKIGSSAITADQQPNVEMIADYMKANPASTCVVKGYASPDGNYEFNVKLAQKRAEAVKTMLVNKYNIAAKRITAEGEGIGKMFETESWNRVSICTLENGTK